MPLLFGIETSVRRLHSREFIYAKYEFLGQGIFLSELHKPVNMEQYFHFPDIFILVWPYLTDFCEYI